VAGLRPPSLNPLDKTMNHDFEARVRDVKSRAHGHWTGILRSLGVDEDILKGKNQPCRSTAAAAPTASSTPTSSAKATTTAARAVPVAD
jgi:hypothetical protein